MKILAILLIISSLFKLGLSLSKNLSHPIINIKETNDLIDPEYLQAICYAILTGDGLIGLFCGAFIVFMT